MHSHVESWRRENVETLWQSTLADEFVRILSLPREGMSNETMSNGKRVHFIWRRKRGMNNPLFLHSVSYFSLAPVTQGDMNSSSEFEVSENYREKGALLKIVNIV